MNLVETKVEEIKITQYGKKIEKAGRVCYKSDSNISDTSYIKFIQNIIKSGHTSVLEHERVAFKMDLKTGINPFCNISQEDHMKYFNISKDSKEEGVIYISANIRGWYEALKEDKDGKIPDNGIYTSLNTAYPFIFTKEVILSMESIQIFFVIILSSLQKCLMNIFERLLNFYYHFFIITKISHINNSFLF